MDESTLKKRSSTNIIKVCILSLLFLYGVSVVVGLFIFPIPALINKISDPVAVSMLSVAFNNFPLLFVILAVVFYMRRAWPGSEKTLFSGYRNNSLKTYFLGAAVGFALNGFLALLAFISGSVSFAFAGFRIGLLLIVIVAGVIQCSAEEVLYRGYVYQFLKGRYGWVAAAVTGSVLFALGHIGNLFSYGLNVFFLINVFAIGFVFVLLMRRSGSFWFVCGVHFMWNFTQQYILGLPNSGLSPLGAIISASASGESIFFSVTYGLEGSLTATILFILLAVVLLIWEKKSPIPEEQSF